MLVTRKFGSFSVKEKWYLLWSDFGSKALTNGYPWLWLKICFVSFLIKSKSEICLVLFLFVLSIRNMTKECQYILGPVDDFTMLRNYRPLAKTTQNIQNCHKIVHAHGMRKKLWSCKTYDLLCSFKMKLLSICPISMVCVRPTCHTKDNKIEWTVHHQLPSMVYEWIGLQLNCMK